MRNYLILTPVRGLPRTGDRRSPVESGEVVTLPHEKAMELAAASAIEPSEAEATVALDWSDVAEITGAPGFTKIDYSGDGSISSLLPSPIAVVAVTDRYALVGAIEDLGGIVFFVGEGLPDAAEDVLADFSNDQLIEEIEARFAEGRLQPVLLSGLIDLAPIAATTPTSATPVDATSDDGAGAVEPASETNAVAVEAAAQEAVSEDTPKTPAAAAPAKPARKKVPAK